MPDPTFLLFLALGAIAVLVLLVTWRKVNAFLALMVAALVVGVGAGFPVAATPSAAPPAARAAGAAAAAAGQSLYERAGMALKFFQDGMGATLGGIAAVIALGAMLGKLLAESGGAKVLAVRFSAFFGPQRVGWCIAALAVAVGLVTWFAVGLLLLLPVLITLSKETKRPFLLLAIPLLSFLSVMHGLMPPHPGPVVAISALGANTGAVLGYGFLVGLPTAAIAGPIFARWVTRYVSAAAPELAPDQNADRPTPGFGVTMFTITLPVALMLLATAVELVPAANLAAGHAVRKLAKFLGDPVFALTAAVFVGVFMLQRSCKFTRKQAWAFTEQSIAGIGMTLLVVGGGGGFARVLKESGVSNAMGHLAGTLHLPPLIYGWMVAAFIRVATGSATVAITTAAGILVPLVAGDPTIHKEMLVLSIGCGSLFLSHLNDGGFWIVKESLGLTVGQTLRTWTITETLVGICGLGVVLVVDFLLRL
ncbi:MAG: gluconate transporter [Verrucomicrobiales bacterium]|nr:gluconate transporter [Verrucomicrobiales bacterium]